MAQIICRDAQDDFDAFRIASGMERAGATVFSVSHNGMHQRTGALIPCAKFIVWAKFDQPVTTDSIDKSISEEYGENN